MRSRISLFDKTCLKKNLIRFAPAWGLYSVCLLMVLVTQMEPGRPIIFAAGIAYTLESMGVVNFFYALIVALLVCGDLYNSRMCNALHALPLRRETWFFTNLLSGLLFSVVPNLALTLLSIAIAPKGLPVFLLWLAVMVMQYLFFFGLATLCAYITGNRFAMALVYGIMSFFAMIAYWLLSTIYIPLLYGVIPRDDFFIDLTPMVRMAQDNYLRVNTYNYELSGLEGPIVFEFREGWGYLAICAAVGVGLIALALHCYRKRNLEKAGDFMTIRGLGPVFLTVYTLCVGALCHLIFNELFGYDSYVFLMLGFAIGFFTGQMLLKRTVRVFRWKSLGGFVLFLVAFAISFCLTRLDPLGITSYIPAPEKVANVSINTDGTYYNWEGNTVWNDIRQIGEIQTVHRYAIENRDQADRYDNIQRVSVTLVYQLKNGKTVTREYRILAESEAGQILRRYVSSPEYVLGWVWTGESQVRRIEFMDPGGAISDPAEIRSLLDAVVADCQSGNLPQCWAYIDGNGDVGWLTLETTTSDGTHYYREIRYTEVSKNVMEWMQAHDIKPEKWG